MQFKNVLALFTVAMTASAFPASNTTNSCNNNNKPVCCPGLLGGILCAVGLVNAQCNGKSFCCKTEAPVGALVNVDMLNCISAL
ncbi:hypothetical protein VTK26DRAFT_9451 [Humicola hyalothermophila]